MTRTFFALVFVLASSWAWAVPEVKVDYAKVTDERRAGRDWIVLDSQASAVLSATTEAILAVLTRYDDYPRLFTHIKEAKAEGKDDVVLLTEKVVVNALGVENVNRFTLRMVRTVDPQNPKVVRLGWTQGWTDGTIDSLEGGWVLEDRGTPEVPQTAVTYRTKSAVPVVVFAQGAFVQMFLGGETKAVLEAVAKAAITR
jgi:hypothetical protein